MRTVALLFAFGVAMAAQEPAMQDSATQDDPQTLLLEAREKVMQTVQRLPRYLCTETVDRTIYQPDFAASGSCDASPGQKNIGHIRKRISDRLRLEVAVSGDSEMYSWVGQDHFDDASLGDLVNGGATSTGTFASLLSSIFGTNDAQFTYNGDVRDQGRVVAEFGFRVPTDKSKFLIGTKAYRTFVGYGGTIWLDPATRELVRLNVHASELPEKLNVCATTTILDYGKTRINGFDFLIPRDAQWDVVKYDGSELKNHMSFSACREFTGSSVLSFDEAPDAASTSAAKAVRAAVAWPVGLSFIIALTEPIQTATAAAGDPFGAKLTRPLKGKHGEILVPAGAKVMGRIVRIERHYGESADALRVSLQVEKIELADGPRPIRAQIGSMVRRRQRLLYGLQAREDLGSFQEMADAGSAGSLEFEDVTADYVIPRGFEMQGRTEEVKK